MLVDQSLQLTDQLGVAAAARSRSIRSSRQARRSSSQATDLGLSEAQVGELAPAAALATATVPRRSSLAMEALETLEVERVALRRAAGSRAPSSPGGACRAACAAVRRAPAAPSTPCRAAVPPRARRSGRRSIRPGLRSRATSPAAARCLAPAISTDPPVLARARVAPRMPYRIAPALSATTLRLRRPAHNAPLYGLTGGLPPR